MAMMIADYQAYAQRDQVLPMPDGYSPDRQINENAFWETGVPLLERIGLVLAGSVVAIIALA
ncbi:hypothetical protein ABTK80_21630, partial [Acinetobacter baumannii]